MPKRWLWYLLLASAWLLVTCSAVEKTVTRDGTDAGMAHALE
jgi:hypothetical protein